MLITKEKHSLSVEKLTDVVREQKKQHCAQTVTKISSDNNFFSRCLPATDFQKYSTKK